MNNTPKLSHATEKLLRFQKEMGGVYLTSDLYMIINAGSDLANGRMIERLVRDDFLTRVKRGVYVTSAFNPHLLAARLIPESYISMETVLAKNGLVGTLSPLQISCVANIKRAQVYAAGTMHFNYHSIREDLYFGFERMEWGICYANSEKAFLDLMTAYQRGKKLPFDPKNEIRLDKLNQTRLTQYLKKYNSPKFKAFIRGLFL
jgi:hypothetical protein